MSVKQVLIKHFPTFYRLGGEVKTLIRDENSSVGPNNIPVSATHMPKIEKVPYGLSVETLNEKRSSYWETFSTFLEKQIKNAESMNEFISPLENAFNNFFPGAKIVYESRYDVSKSRVEILSDSNVLEESKKNALKSRIDNNISLDSKDMTITFNGNDNHITFMVNKNFSYDEKSEYWKSDIKYLGLLKSYIDEKMKNEEENIKRKLYDNKLNVLFNYSYGMNKLNEEIKRNERYGTPCSVIIFDIDHFKKINSQYLYEDADEILMEVASIIEGSCRQQLDIPFRYGGEELGVILPETAIEGAIILAERIRKKIYGLEVNFSKYGKKQVFVEEEVVVDGKKDTKKMPFSISVGVHQIGKGQDRSEVIDLVSFALNKSKANGRNQTTFYHPDLNIEFVSWQKEQATKNKKAS